MKFLLVLFFVAAIPLFECYRFVRESPYRYRVERSIPKEETYRFARSPVNSDYRVAPNYRYRIHRSIDDNDKSEIVVETPDKQILVFNSNNPYRYRIVEAENPPPKSASNETPPDCSDGDKKVC
uniref:Uncharacterized protein n=1 Tax=Panagrolaimus sp. PS1159 TaxID=55785 RepID=A0AC35F1E4_9BILA